MLFGARVRSLLNPILPAISIDECSSLRGPHAKRNDIAIDLDLAKRKSYDGFKAHSVEQTIANLEVFNKMERCCASPKSITMA